VTFFSIVCIDHRIPGNSSIHLALASSSFLCRSWRITLFAASAWLLVCGCAMVVDCAWHLKYLRDSLILLLLNWCMLLKLIVHGTPSLVMILFYINFCTSTAFCLYAFGKVINSHQNVLSLSVGLGKWPYGVHAPFNKRIVGWAWGSVGWRVFFCNWENFGIFHLFWLVYGVLLVGQPVVTGVHGCNYKCASFNVRHALPFVDFFSNLLVHLRCHAA